LLQRISILPKVSTTPRTAAAQSVLLRTSQEKNFAFAPNASISLTAAAPPSSLTSSTPIAAPASASFRATPSPIPDAAPEITATFPSNEMAFKMLSLTMSCSS
jgi:hypothetical protein